MATWTPGPGATAGNDVFVGDSTDEIAEGQEGDDTLSGNAGDDRLDGGAGSDVVNGGDGDDTLVARYSLVNIETLDGGPDTDTLLVYGEVDLRFSVVASIERLTIYNPYSFLPAGVAHFGNSGAGLSTTLIVDGDIGFEIRVDAGPTRSIDASGWTFVNVFGTVNLNGTTGNDTLIGSIIGDILDGGVGVDLMVGGAGSDVYIVDHADDVVSETASDAFDAVVSYLVSYTLAAEVEQLWLGAAAQTGIGNELANEIGGTSGANTIRGLSGEDWLKGFGGADSLEGGDGADRLDGGAGADVLNGGDGSDTADYIFASATLGVSVNLQTGMASGGDAEGDVLQLVENVRGSGQNDTLIGDAGANLLDGVSGDDTLDGGGGNDVLRGGFGNDAMTGGLGDDYYYAEHAGDVITELAGQGTDTVETALANYTMVAHTENLILSGSADINATGTTAANVMTGNSGANTLIGGLGNDVLQGLGGKDLLTGGGGLDTFVFTSLSDSAVAFAGREAINTFAHGDKIDLSAIDANTTIAGNQAFTWTPGGFTGVAGQLYVQQNAARSWTVWADVNGDAVADFALNIYGAPSLNNGIFAWDFIL